MRDCGRPTITRTCVAHNVQDCACCIKADHECDHGSCHATATATVRAISTSTERAVEIRQLCERHVAVAVMLTDGGRYRYECGAIATDLG